MMNKIPDHYKKVEVTRTFTEHVKKWSKGNASKMLEQIKKEFPNHQLCNTPPFPYVHRQYAYCITFERWPGMHLFVTTRTKEGGTALITGGMYYAAQKAAEDNASGKPRNITNERPAILRYMLEQSEATEYEEDKEVIDKLIADIKAGLHLRLKTEV